MARRCEVCDVSIDHKRSHARFCDRVCKGRASQLRRVADGRARAADRARYPAEAEHRRAYAMQYLRDNPERMRAIRRKRKGQIKAAGFLFTERDWRRMVHRYRDMCAYCQERPIEHRDHVIPLAKQGVHGVGNLLPACASCNLRKKTKLLAIWRYRDGAARALSPGREVIPTP